MNELKMDAVSIYYTVFIIYC